MVNKTNRVRYRKRTDYQKKCLHSLDKSCFKQSSNSKDKQLIIQSDDLPNSIRVVSVTGSNKSD
jgi:hypothetical protein